MIKAIFQAIAQVLKIILIAVKGDQPKRDEIEQSTQDLWQENKQLQEQLEQKIKEKENEKGN